MCEKLSLSMEVVNDHVIDCFRHRELNPWDS